MTRSRHREHWTLDPDVDFLNHGSFGACPRTVLETQQELRAAIEREPVRFLGRELESMFDHARASLGGFLGADPDDLAFVANATTGINTVLRSLAFEPGDELVVTTHEYNASRNALEFAAGRAGLAIRVVDLPFPIDGPGDVVDRVLAAFGPRTRLLLIDHITSPTALVLPLEQIIPLAQAHGIDVLVDGAHAPGMLPLDLDALGAAYYTGNCHKWLCAPKGAAFLHVRRDLQDRIRPLVISHGANSPRTDRSRFRIEADWLGTIDPTPWLCLPAALAFLRELFEGGFPALRAHNHDLVVAGRARLCEVLGIEPPCPESMLGSLASVPLPDGDRGGPPLYLDPLQVALFDDHRIEVPIMPWPAPPHRLLRMSGQAYNDSSQYERLAAALAARR